MLKLKSKQVGVEPIYDSDYYNPTSKLIQIPQQAKERCDQGIIKCMGADCDPALKIGDHIIFSGYTGTTIGIDDGIIIVIHSDFIKAIINDNIVEVEGLYLRSRDGTYFTAHSDTALRLVADALSEKFNISVKREEHEQQHDKFDGRK